ncbi:heavy-metal-associated domain-containing protein [Gynurincola endophyticus]|uniref:heavy-metal-associated domain-containing protein n=1 Tax=Gynurincola endophyticus TaxID=2479004 RepID=UPI000F8C5145|nr:heavy metal-associated domain-containing protein [Gynurincola endophyticus]
MKNIVLAVVCFLVAHTANAQFSSARLEATGLTCALCTKAINSSLEALPFVESVDVDIVTTSFMIKFKDQQKVVIDDVKKAVEDAGFSVGKLFMKRNFSDVAIKNDEHVNIDGQVFHFLKVKSQVLSGEQEIQVVDKNFLTSKSYQTFAKSSSKECVKTGKVAGCCEADNAVSNRVYHVTI